MTGIQMVDEPDGGRAYRAGACNIGPSEIRRRRAFGLFAAAVTVVLAVILVATDSPTWARLLIFFSAAGAAVGFLQARYRFCVSFAIAGVSNFGPLGREDRVTDAADHRADVATAARILGLSAVVGAVVAIGFALLPI
jgi:hypothetical protein